MFKISKHLNWYQYSNKLVIRNLRSSEIFSIESTKKDVWLLICKGKTTECICEELSDLYEIPQDDLSTKITDVIQFLVDMNLIYTT